MGNHGPMQLEVPADQYAGAVETMKNKIREGKDTRCNRSRRSVPADSSGTSDLYPGRNITRFGHRIGHL